MPPTSDVGFSGDFLAVQNLIIADKTCYRRICAEGDSHMKMTTVMAGLALFGSGCASTSVMPISQNEIILTTSAAPVCGTAGAQQIAAKMAAIETLRRGFDRYLIGGAQSQNNVRATALAPTSSYTTAQASTYGNTTYGSATTNYYGGGVMYSGTHDASLRILMLKPGDYGYDNGVDARTTLGPEWEKLVQDGIQSC